MSNPSIKDLIVLAADRQMQATIKGLLLRPKALGIRDLNSRIFVHPEKDPGCLLDSHFYLRRYLNDYSHALVMFDREGCGQEQSSREELETRVEKLLSDNGWDERAKTIVFDPELEIWVWSNSSQVDSILGWDGMPSGLRTWLKSQNCLLAGKSKPDHPKETLDKVLEEIKRVKGKGRDRESTLYLQLASKVSIKGCTDPTFVKFNATLQGWFP